MKTSWFAKFVCISTLSFMLLSIGLRCLPAYALPATDDPPEKAIECLGDLQGTISSTPQPVNLWQTATLRWNVTVPSICTGTGVKLYVDNQVVSPTGSQTIQPIANTSYRLHATLPAVFGGGRRTLATTTAKVIMPPVVTINANYMVPLLLQALRDPFVPGTSSRYIYIENHVELNLSGREFIPIVGGITLAGGRTARQPGPRLYTTTSPRVLFSINGDNVRITGVRIQGPDMGISNADGICCSGIFLNSSVNIDIHNNEIFGWRNSAVEIRDNISDRISVITNPETVRVRNNYIHHNQHVGKMGYGVTVKDGAYALIERNVFDYNRHAIEGDGSDGSGYRAYRNLVLENGGYHDTYNACDLPDWIALVSPGAWLLAEALCIIPGSSPSYVHYTHQFDMHGQENCGISGAFNDAAYNCGTAGHDMEIRYNSFFYTKGNAIKLRGTPQLQPHGAFVISNVFAHDRLFDPGLVLGGAVAQTETGLFLSNNLVGVNGLNELGSCDFDGDGINDSFLATGQTWWYSSGGDKPWVYLNTSTKRRSEVTLGFFNADNICDVSADGIIYPGGKTQTPRVNSLPGGGVITTAP
jgi:hypothetical protein